MDENSISERFQKLLSNVPLITINPRFEGLIDITKNMRPVLYEFKDDRNIRDQALIFVRMTDEEINKMGRETLPMLASGFSRRGVGNLFMLAYNLRDPASADNKYIFHIPDNLLNVLDKPVSDLDEEGTVQPLPATDHPRKEAIAYSYIAASTLRMFTKPEVNYVKAYSHILSEYAKFYGHKMVIVPPRPIVEALRTLTHKFSYDPLFKISLYKLLYMGGDVNTAGDGLRKLLYESHLANTGLHVVSIFERLCEVFKCDPTLLLTTIHPGKYGRQVRGLKQMLKLVENKDCLYTRKMWRYGRLFDETFMDPLRTKSCPRLVYILASALKESTENNNNILEITQLSDIPAADRKELAEEGQMVARYLADQTKSNSS